MVIVDPVFISCDLCNNSLAAIPTNRHWLNDEQQQRGSPKSNFIFVFPYFFVSNEGIVCRMLEIMVYIDLVAPSMFRIHSSHCAIYGNFLGAMISIKLVYCE